MLDRTAIKAFVDKARALFRTTSNLSEAFKRDRDNQVGPIDPGSWDRHKPIVEQLGDSLSELDDVVQSPPAELQPIANELNILRAHLEMIWMVMASAEGRAFGSYRLYSPELYSSGYNGEMAVQSVIKALDLDNPFGFRKCGSNEQQPSASATEAESKAEKTVIHPELEQKLARLEYIHELAKHCLEALGNLDLERNLYDGTQLAPAALGFLWKLVELVKLLKLDPDPFSQDKPVQLAGRTGTSAHAIAFTLAEITWQNARLSFFTSGVELQFASQDGNSIRLPREVWTRFKRKLESSPRIQEDAFETALKLEWCKAKTAASQTSNAGSPSQNGKSAKSDVKANDSAASGADTSTWQAAPIEAFPVPAGATWSQLTIRFVDGLTVSVALGDVRRRYTYIELGMADARNKRPNKQWELLRALAAEGGKLSWNSSAATRKNQKRKEVLSKTLKACFPLGGEPIVATPDGGWETVFKIESD